MNNRNSLVDIVHQRFVELLRNDTQRRRVESTAVVEFDQLADTAHKVDVETRDSPNHRTNACGNCRHSCARHRLGLRRARRRHRGALEHVLQLEHARLRAFEQLRRLRPRHTRARRRTPRRREAVALRRLDLRPAAHSDDEPVPLAWDDHRIPPAQASDTKAETRRRHRGARRRLDISLPPLLRQHALGHARWLVYSVAQCAADVDEQRARGGTDGTAYVDTDRQQREAEKIGDVPNTPCADVPLEGPQNERIEPLADRGSDAFVAKAVENEAVADANGAGIIVDGLDGKEARQESKPRREHGVAGELRSHGGTGGQPGSVDGKGCNIQPRGRV